MSLPFHGLSCLFLRPLEKIYEAVFCRSDIGIISVVESNGADDEKAAGREGRKVGG